MFRLDQSAKYRWPVKGELVAEDGNQQSYEFHVHFRRVGMAEVEEMVKATQDSSMTDRQIVEELVVGWEGVLDADEHEMPFSSESLAILCDIVRVRAAIVRAWFDSLREGPAKNSEAPPSPG